MWYKVVLSGRDSLRPWDAGAENEEPVENRPISTIDSPSLNEFCAFLTSGFAVAEILRRQKASTQDDTGRRKADRLRVTGTENVSRQSSNPGRRKRTAQGPSRIQAGDRREIQSAILHHKFGWQGCSSVSLRGMGANRAEAGRALQFQSHEEKISGPDELLRAAGRDGRAGTAVAAAVIARDRADQGRGSGSGKFDVSRGQEPGAVQAGDRGRKVHA